tara:strand:- start:1654 stop:2094 length:441 start_codon:yes stop_codon:yes gene_type:complete
MDVNKILLDLEIIKQIKSDDKLAILQEKGDTKFYVDHYSYLSPVKRWFYGYKRDDTITYLEKLIDNIEKSSNTIINGNHLEIGNFLKNSIKESFDGLNNLKITYQNDSIINSKIILIVSKLQNIVDTLDKFITPDIKFLEQLENNN